MLGRRQSRVRLIAFDIAVTAGYMLLLLPAAASAPADVPSWVPYALTAAIIAPVAVRRVWPVPVFVVVLTLTVAATLLRATVEPFLAAAYAVYPVAIVRPNASRVSTPVKVILGVVVGVALVLVVSGPTHPGATMAQSDPGWTGAVAMLAFGCALLAGVWIVGRAVRERREYAARTAERLAERAVTEERLRIARELHDIVAHGMSLIAVKAGVANHVLRERPEEAHDALRLIETTSRGALTEMRRMLGVLRADGDDPPADLGPAPGLAGLPGLAERAAMAGVRVDTDVRGVDGLPEGVALAAYRIVQEAVTNVIKHAAPATCCVVVTGEADALTVEVTDDGPGTRVSPEIPGTGHGLVGMRERAAVYGGTLTAGPRPGGGFAVTARIPIGQ